MKTTTSLLRAIGLALIGFLILHFAVESGDGWGFTRHPILWAVWGVFILIIVAVEMIMAALNRILYESLTAEQKQRHIAAEAKRRDQQFGWIKRKYKALMDAKPVAKEEEILLDHNYDGIRELDNNLPPWWVYLFYVTIIFAVGYLAYYQIFGGTSQTEEYKQEMAQAKIAIEKYKAEHKDLVDEKSVELLTDDAELQAGEAIFTANCVACHGPKGGGGIGPNLTDDYWILGGGIKNVFHTIKEGGRSGKGMVAWKGELKPHEIAQVASYVISLAGSNPPNAKEPQGEKWEGDDE